jgi:hypothetical protein
LSRRLWPSLAAPAPASLTLTAAGKIQEDIRMATIQSLIAEIDGLKARQPEESKFKDWKEKVEKQLEESYGKASQPAQRFKRCRFFSFERSGKPRNAPLSEAERREFIRCLEEAKRSLQGLA